MDIISKILVDNFLQKVYNNLDINCEICQKEEKSVGQ